mmetsp:Transcript_133206/g.231002  ORF Transcript_133206/g.231002 Transcript_133206/m.231002 type:complete len:219 (-) Transcript_133206:1998-2654(-)
MERLLLVPFQAFLQNVNAPHGIFTELDVLLGVGVVNLLLILLIVGLLASQLLLLLIQPVLHDVGTLDQAVLQVLEARIFDLSCILFGQLGIWSLQFLGRHLSGVRPHQLLDVWRQVVLLLLTPLLLLLLAPKLCLLILLRLVTKCIIDCGYKSNVLLLLCTLGENLLGFLFTVFDEGHAFLLFDKQQPHLLTEGCRLGVLGIWVHMLNGDGVALTVGS